MNSSKTPASAGADSRRAEQLEIARRLYEALVVQDPNRVAVLCDGDGRVIARHDLGPEPPDTALACAKIRAGDE
jgi:hypothetical protein